MQVDLLAGTAYGAWPMPQHSSTILIFDSGLGGLTVLTRVMAAQAGARIVYAADDAGFPYGRLDGDRLVARVLSVMETLVARCHPISW